MHTGSFLRCETKLNSKVSVLPASKDSKAYQLLSDKLAIKKDEKRQGKKKARLFKGDHINPEKMHQQNMKVTSACARSERSLSYGTGCLCKVNACLCLCVR